MDFHIRYVLYVNGNWQPRREILKNNVYPLIWWQLLPVPDNGRTARVLEVQYICHSKCRSLWLVWLWYQCRSWFCSLRLNNSWFDSHSDLIKLSSGMSLTVVTAAMNWPSGATEMTNTIYICICIMDVANVLPPTSMVPPVENMLSEKYLNPPQIQDLGDPLLRLGLV